NPLLMGHDKRGSVPHVLQPHAAGHVGDWPDLARQGYGARIQSGAIVGGGEPDLIARWRPENSLHRLPARRKFLFLFLAIRADDGHGTLVVSPGIFMIGEGDP